MRKQWQWLYLFCVMFSMSPIAAAGSLEPVVQLGKIMYQDLDFSFNSSQSCMTCHHHVSGFADPDNSRDPYLSVVSVGADGVSLGGRNAPSSAYTGYSPVLDWDDGLGGYAGGMFWDGRATGRVLGDPLAEQAQGPPLNPAEMKMPDKEAVVQVVRDAPYANLFLKVFGPGSLDDTQSAYNLIARAIAAYERSPEVQKFSSRFDRGCLTVQELNGRELFEEKCSKCHPAVPSGSSIPPLFTAHTYENIGLPPNPLLAGNPVDLGLGGFLESDFNALEPLIGDARFADQYGKFKVPSLRNVAMTAPYGHNGVFPTLKTMVDFLNTRDTGQWPAPEVTRNMNTADTGNMGLTEAEVDDIVAFLMTLTDPLCMGPRPHGKTRHCRKHP